MVGEARAHVQDESLKARAALLVRLLNSPSARGESEMAAWKICTLIVGLGIAGVAIFFWSAAHPGLAAPTKIASPQSVADLPLVAPENRPKPVVPETPAAMPISVDARIAVHASQVSIIPRDPDHSDPYSNDIANAALVNYLSDRAQVMGATKNMYYAVGCRVLAETDVMSFFLGEYGTLRHSMDADGLIDKYALPDLKMEAASGFGMAKAEGCSYWHDNPDQVILFRESARAAVGLVQQMR